MEERGAGVTGSITVWIVKSPFSLHCSSRSPIDEKSTESPKTEPTMPSEEAIPANTDALFITHSLRYP